MNPYINTYLPTYIGLHTYTHEHVKVDVPLRHAGAKGRADIAPTHSWPWH
jgi:hypothetical protein